MTPTVAQLKQVLKRCQDVQDALADVLNGRGSEDEHSLVRGVVALTRQLAEARRERELHGQDYQQLCEQFAVATADNAELLSILQKVFSDIVENYRKAEAGAAFNGLWLDTECAVKGAIDRQPHPGTALLDEMAMVKEDHACRGTILNALCLALGCENYSQLSAEVARLRERVKEL